ncbi:MAG: PEP-CTERM sorting domain-containing protein [Armatimonadota bacterium]
MRRLALLPVVVTALALSSVAWAQAPPAPFFNGFETDTSGWVDYSGTVTRVPSGTDGIPSADGDYHAKVTGLCYTRWGGYSGVWPDGGFVTELDIYLDVTYNGANDTRFDWTSAISTPANAHRRDFVFNAGFYTDLGAPAFVISASNNAGRANSYPKNPGRDPVTISNSGWYTFRHSFYDSGSGVLAVDMSIWDAGGNNIKTWTLSDPTDIIGSTVGGNRYGWFASNEFPYLAIDNSYRSGTDAPEPATWVLLAATGILGIVRGRRR